MRIAGVIVAGGEANRLGGEKPFVPFRGGTLLGAVAARIRPQVSALALNLRADAAYSPGGFPVLFDTVSGNAGPLAGIVTALAWAGTLDKVDWLLSVPGDTPFLPEDLVATLQRNVAPGHPVYAHDGVRAQYLCALWPLGSLRALREGVANGRLRSLYRAHEELGSIASAVAAPAHAFFNVNTPEDLAEAERLAAG